MASKKNNNAEIRIDNIYDKAVNEIESSKETINILIKFLLILLIFIFGGVLGFWVNDLNLNLPKLNSRASQLQTFTPEQRADSLELNKFDYDLYENIAANLKELYVDENLVEEKKLFEGSIKGMVDSIGDKATVYFDSEEYKEFKDSFGGEFEGIGVRLDYRKDGGVEVVEVFPNSPASDVGVLQGFVFNEVDGENVYDEAIENIVSKVRGKKGTIVKIEFYNPDEDEFKEFEIKRDRVEVESMTLTEYDSDTVIFSVSRFTEDSLDIWKSLWDKKVDEINSKGYKKVILDMRGNGGGYLDAAKYAAGDFLESGDLILTEVTRGKDNKESRSSGRLRLGDKKVVILVDGGTASASEILAGALKFNKDEIVIIGTNTFGKGTVQNTFEIKETGGALKLTTEYWLLPDGKRLTPDNPIIPDIEIEREKDTRKGLLEDKVIKRAVEELSK